MSEDFVIVHLVISILYLYLLYHYLCDDCFHNNFTLDLLAKTYDLQKNNFSH